MHHQNVMGGWTSISESEVVPMHEFGQFPRLLALCLLLDDNKMADQVQIWGWRLVHQHTYVRDTGITIAEIIGSHCERGLYRCGTIGDLAMFPNHYHQCHEWALVFLEFSGADLDRKGSWDG